jgi:hypothetical protein
LISDIRIAITFKGHRKRKRLTRTLGPGATDYLLDLWITIATDRPDGILAGWDEIDISDAAGWTGTPEELVAALVKCGFLEQQNGHYAAHDWEEHQGWACGAKVRSERARKAAQAKWGKKAEQAPRNAEAMRPAMRKQCAEHAPSNAQAMRPAMREHKKVSAPSPSPTPSPKPSSSPFRKSGDLRLAGGGDFYLTKKKKKLQGSRLEAFEKFWTAFDYKKGKAAAADAWWNIPGLKDDLVERIVAAAEAEAKQRPELVARGRTPQYAEGWLNGRRWEDEEVGSNDDAIEEGLKRAGL